MHVQLVLSREAVCVSAALPCVYLCLEGERSAISSVHVIADGLSPLTHKTHHALSSCLSLKGHVHSYVQIHS